MFSCNNPISSFGELFLGCKQGPTKIKKVGEYIYHYDYQIGSGTYSQVYEGVSLQNDKAVAIKVIDLQLVKQRKLISLLYQQTQLMSQLNHPNVIKCHALLKSQNRCYIITELCKKDNLEVLVQKAKNNRLPLSQVERIIYDIFQGLSYLAQRAIIHRDLKTANILFSQSGKAKIADFGFATHGLNQFKDNVFVGTPLYMSPQAILEQKYSSKTDIWSFGVIVYQLMFGFTPLNNCKDQNQLLERIVKPVQIPPSQNVSKQLQELIEGCLEQNSIYRWNIDRLAKSAYIQNLKKKYNIQSNLFQPLKIQSQDSHSSNKTTGTGSAAQKKEIKQNSLQFLSSIPIKTNLKAKTQSGKSQKSPQKQKQKSKLTIHMQSSSPVMNTNNISQTSSILNKNFREQSPKKSPTNSNVGIASPNSNLNTLTNIKHNLDYSNANMSKTPNNIQSYKSQNQLKYETNYNHHSAITYSQPNNNNQYNPSSYRYVKAQSDVRVERQSFGAFQKFNNLNKVGDNPYNSLQANPNTLNNTGNQIKYVNQVPHLRINFNTMKTQQPVRVSRQISWNQQQYTINQARRSQLPPPHMIRKDYINQTQQFNSLHQSIRKSQVPIHLSSANNKKQVLGESLFVNKQLTYKQAVSLVHYCRLLHKIIQFPRYYNKNLKQWLLFLIRDLKQNAQVNSLKQAHTVSLKNVLQGYYSQYINQHNLQKARSGLNAGQKAPQIKTIIKILKSLQDVDQKNKDKSLQKQLLHNLIKQTQNLQQCLQNKESNFQKYARQTKCQLYLDWFNNKDSKGEDDGKKL